MLQPNTNDASIVAIEQCDRSKKTIVFIDSTVENWQVLAEEVILEAEIVILNHEEDGIAQIDRKLRSHNQLDSVHIVSHGSPGCLYLGNSTLNLDNLGQYASLLKSWSSLLDAIPLLIYGCRVAADEVGRKFLQRLQSLTGASISASALPTGHHSKGGDWELEVGRQYAIAFSQTVTESYAGILATFTVNTIADENDGINTGKVSLRDAIAAANSSAGSDTIEFDASLNGTIKLANGVLQIADDVTINDTGSGITVDGDNKSRVFKVDDGNANNRIEAAIDGLTIAGGSTYYALGGGGDLFSGSGAGVLNREKLTITNSLISGNLGESSRGSIGNAGELSIYDSTITNNPLGIVNQGTLTVKRSKISGNKYSAIENDNGFYAVEPVTTVIIDSEISNNSGQGIINGVDTTLTVVNSTISGNKNGISNVGTLIVANSLISDNQDYGFGVSGINNRGTATITNSTISGNASVGISNSGQNLRLTNSTIAKNQGGGLINTGQDTQIVNIDNSIIAGNLNSDVELTRGSKVDIFSQGGNVIGIGNAIANFIGEGDLVGISDPGIEDLANNGGLTLTHALKPDSPAINAGNNNNLIADEVTTDQRGEPRIQDGKVDAGAFESNFAYPLTPIVTLIPLGNFIIEGEPQAAFRLSRSGNTATPLDVNLSVVADAGLTIEELNLDGTTGNFPDLTFTILAGESFVNFLTAIDDGNLEADENLTLTLKPSDAYQSDRVSNNVTVAILDASNFVVTNTNDSGQGSLRQAILNANRIAGANTITFDTSLAGQTINLTSGGLNITDDLTVTGLGADKLTVRGGFGVSDFDLGNFKDLLEVKIEGLTITEGGIGNTENLTVKDSIITGGSGIATSSLDERYYNKLTVINSTIGNTDYGIITGESSVTISDSTIANNNGWGIEDRSGSYYSSSSINVNNSNIRNNNGGGIFGAGFVTVTNSTISDNTNGGGIFAREVEVNNSTISGNTSSGDGGGINVMGRSLGIAVNNSKIYNNTASGDGGGINCLSLYGNLEVVNSTISGNTSSYNGGGIDVYTQQGITSITGSTIDGNRANRGGGIYATSGFDGVATVTNSTISNNEATQNGGGIRAFSPKGFTVANSTISGNKAAENGGGIETYAYEGVSFANITVTNNASKNGGGIFNSPRSSSKVNLKNAIVAGNIDTLGNDNPDISGAFTSNGFNLISNTSGSTDFENDLVEPDINKILDPNLADNGGLTRTHALVPGSPAINAGNNSDIPNGITTDQRGEGFSRIVGGTVDIGAYEGVFAEPFLVTNTNDSGVGSLRQAILNANNIAGANTITFDTGLAGQTIDLTSGVIGISDDLTIAGLGADKLTVRSGGFAFSSGFYLSGFNYKLEGLTITNSGIFNSDVNLTVNDCVVIDGDNGGITNNNGKLTVINSTISGNTGFGIKNGYGSGLTVIDSTIANNDGAGIQDNQESFASIKVSNSEILNNTGGGISAVESVVTVTDSTVFGNSTNDSGGGIAAAALTLTNSIVSGNTAGGNDRFPFIDGGGGGILAFGDLTVTNSTISDNTAEGNGGGISSLFGSFGMTITNSTISGNTASGRGGGINLATQGVDYEAVVTNSTIDGNRATQGGGINFFPLFGQANITVANSTISGNEATDKGGGMYTYGYGGKTTAFVANTTVTKNSAKNGGGIFNANLFTAYNDSNIKVKNAIIAGNIDTNGNDNSDVSGVFISNGSNLIGDKLGSRGFENDLVESDINKILDRNLADNGGLTRTHALVPGSRAINAGNNSDIPEGITTDQRGEGFSRIVGGKVDIGAYELQTTGNAINGTDGDDNLDGTAEDDIINGLAGNDFIDGKAGNDTIDGGTGNLDRIFGSDGNDTIIDRDGVNGAHGGVGNDTIEVTFAASWDNDNKPGSSPRSDGKISGGYGDDDITVTMNKNNFFINLKGDEPKGNNSQDGNDTITLLGKYGNSVVDLGGGNDTFNGSGGKDNVSSGNGNDLIIGLGGSDRIAGGNGNDILIGGAGKDELIGGQNSDIFVLASGEGTDYLSDFTDNSDLIGLAGGLSFADLTITGNGKNTQLAIASTDELLAVLNGVNPNTLSAADFTAV